MSEEDVKQFKLRLNPSPRHTYSSLSKVLAIDMQVPVLPGKQEELIHKLAASHESNHHTFPGTITSYLVTGDDVLDHLHIVLFRKYTDMPDETTRQLDFEAFQDELADVLDWDSAHTTTNEPYCIPKSHVNLFEKNGSQNKSLDLYSETNACWKSHRGERRRYREENLLGCVSRFSSTLLMMSCIIWCVLLV